MKNSTAMVILVLLALLPPLDTPAVGQDGARPTSEKPQQQSTPKTTPEPGAGAPDWSAQIIASGAATEIIEEHSAKLNAWAAKLETTIKLIEGDWTADDQLRNIPKELDKLRSELRAFIDQQKPKLKDAKDRLAKLGDAPKEGEAEEAESLAVQRKAIGQEVAAHDGLIKQAEVFVLDAAQKIEQSNIKRRDRFAQNLLKPAPMFYSTDTWQRVLTDLAVHTSRSWARATTAISGKTSKSIGRLLVMFLLPVIVFIAASAALRSIWPEKSYTGLYADNKPPRSARAYRAVSGIARGVMPWLFALLTLYGICHLFGYINTSNQRFFTITLVTLAAASLLIAMVRCSVRNKDAAWNVIGRGNEKPGPLRFVGIALIATWAADQILTQADLFLDAPYPLTVARGTLFSLAYAGLMLALLLLPLKPHATGSQARFRGWPAPVFLIVTTLIFAISVATMMGYISLSRFMGAQFVTTGGIILLMFLVHMFAEYITSEHSGASAEDANVSILQVTTGLFLDTAILIIGIPALLLQWGFDWTEVEGWIRTAFFGFQIGGLTISLQALLIALAILIAGILLTRFVQRSFVHRTHRTGRMNQGVRDSVRTGLGYLGFILSVLASASFLGIDFSNLAIVAGALSLGLGFGMQSIFNNFVSGLILLVERPIKIGDWINVGSEEGWVRKINVRATELETLHKESVIIPNSELISGTVKNWMYSDDLARITVPIGVSYRSDAELVRDILLEVAKSNPQVLKYPIPSVIFTGFGDSSLDFELRVFIANVNSRIQIASDIRFAILKSLREHGVEIPFPQRDLHIRNLGDLKKAISQRDAKKAETVINTATEEPKT